MNFEQLVEIIKANDVAKLGEALDAGVDVNMQDKDGWNLVITAAENGAAQCLQLLVDRGAEINHQTNSYEYTALSLASHNAKIECMKILLEVRACPELRDQKLNTALHSAYNGGTFDDPETRAAMELLLEHRALIDAPGFEGKTLLMYAIEDTDMQAVNFLLEHNASVDAKNPTNGATALFYSASQGLNECTKLLLERRANVDAESKSGYTPLIYAAAADKVNTVKLLLDYKADANIRDYKHKTALMYAAAYASDECFNLILDGTKTEGIDVADNDGATALMYAAQAGQSDKVLSLIWRGANVNAKNNEEKTPLDYVVFSEDATGEDCLKTVKIFLSCGVDYMPTLVGAQADDSGVELEVIALLRQAEFTDKISDLSESAKKLIKPLVFSSKWSNDTAQEGLPKFSEVLSDLTKKVTKFLANDEVEQSTKDFVAKNVQYLDASLPSGGWSISTVGSFATAVNFLFQYGDQVVGASDLWRLTPKRQQGFLKAFDESEAEKYSLGEYLQMPLLNVLQKKAVDDQQAFASVPKDALSLIASFLGMSLQDAKPSRAKEEGSSSVAAKRERAEDEDLESALKKPKLEASSSTEGASGSSASELSEIDMDAIVAFLIQGTGSSTDDSELEPLGGDSDMEE